MTGPGTGMPDQRLMTSPMTWKARMSAMAESMMKAVEYFVRFSKS